MSISRMSSLAASMIFRKSSLDGGTIFCEPREPITLAPCAGFVANPEISRAQEYCVALLGFFALWARLRLWSECDRETHPLP
jgi:hypothetical protein